MQSLELNRAYYQDCVSTVLGKHCPQVAMRHAAALVGWGSEVLGNDDEFSRRYGWGPRVVLFLTKEDHQTWAERLLESLQEHIPATFLGHPTRYTNDGPPQPTTEPKAPVGIAITTCERFLELYLGVSRTDFAAKPLPSREWLLICEERLLRLTAGEMYHDSVGTLTGLRAYFKYFPDDVWRHRLAYQWTTLSWDIDLIELCADRGDTLSARIAAARSVERIVGLVFLLNKIYKPAYLKWLHRQFYKLPFLAAEVGPMLKEAAESGDSGRVTKVLCAILDRLIPFQCSCAGIPMPDYERSPGAYRGIFKYDLQPVVQGIRESIHGELRALPTTIGAVDQWITDQDLAMVPEQLRLLRGLYDCQDPERALFERTKLEDQGI